MSEKQHNKATNCGFAYEKNSVTRRNYRIWKGENDVEFKEIEQIVARNEDLPENADLRQLPTH